MNKKKQSWIILIIAIVVLIFTGFHVFREIKTEDNQEENLNEKYITAKLTDEEKTNYNDILYFWYEPLSILLTDSYSNIIFDNNYLSDIDNKIKIAWDMLTSDTRPHIIDELVAYPEEKSIEQDIFLTKYESLFKEKITIEELANNNYFQNNFKIENSIITGPNIHTIYKEPIFILKSSTKTNIDNNRYILTADLISNLNDGIFNAKDIFIEYGESSIVNYPDGYKVLSIEFIIENESILSIIVKK